jgi:hypothetical protein
MAQAKYGRGSGLALMWPNVAAFRTRWPVPRYSVSAVRYTQPRPVSSDFKYA